MIKATSNDGPYGFSIAGFALGLLLLLVGVVLACVTGGTKDQMRNRGKWAWIGFSVFLALLIILAIGVASAFHG